jgi:hypothetical protein
VQHTLQLVAEDWSPRGGRSGHRRASLALV